MWISILSPLVLSLLLVTAPAHALGDSFNECVLELINSSPDDVTVGEIRQTCQDAQEIAQPAEPEPVPPKKKSAIDRRLAVESATEVVPFVITPHRPNYIIYSYNFKDYEESQYEKEFNEDVSFRPSEVDFQVSFKSPVWRKIFKSNTNLFVGYTNRSFWQVFDDEDSSPFRETNHEPEAWLSFRTRWELLGVTGRIMQAGFSHQSNGRGGELSRSWNRVFANLIFESGDFYYALKPWFRIQEAKSEDDNPDIEDYMGYFEFHGVYNRGRQNLGFMFRNQLKDDYRGALELDWSFPVRDHVRGYVQYFHGYGDSLIDYDNKVNKLGIGVKLTDWL